MIQSIGTIYRHAATMLTFTSVYLQCNLYLCILSVLLLRCTLAALLLAEGLDNYACLKKHTCDNKNKNKNTHIDYTLVYEWSSMIEPAQHCIACWSSWHHEHMHTCMRHHGFIKHGCCAMSCHSEGCTYTCIQNVSVAILAQVLLKFSCGCNSRKVGSALC